MSNFRVVQISFEENVDRRTGRLATKYNVINLPGRVFDKFLLWPYMSS